MKGGVESCLKELTWNAEAIHAGGVAVVTASPEEADDGTNLEELAAERHLTP